MAANIRCIMRAKAPYGQGITKMKVKLTPEQSSTPSLMPETNSVYLSRPTEGTGELMELVGGSVAWNQLCNSSSVTGTSGHKFYLKKSGVESITNTNTFTGLASGTDMVTDLTQMLGQTIADYVYSLEQATAGSGVQWLKNYGYFTEDYIAYSAPILRSVEASAHVTIGKNQCFNPTGNFGTEGVPNIYYPTGDGLPIGVNNLLYTAYAKVERNTDYVFSCDGTPQRHIVYGLDSYPALGVICHALTVSGSGSNWTFNSGRYNYVGFYYSNDIANAPTNIQIEKGSTATAYEPYTERTYPFGTTTLRGMLKTDADGNLYYDGDTYEWDGTVTRKYGEAVADDSKSYTVSTVGSYTRFVTPISGAKYPGGTQFSNYLPYKVSYAEESEHFYINTNDLIAFILTSKCGSTEASVKTYLASNPLEIIYELATPTTESADPFAAVQAVEDGGTEEFVTTNGVPVGVVGRFANAVPMDGVDSFTVTANDGTSHTYPVTLSEEIYRGYVDMLTGEAVSDMASIAEYNGETINVPWLSSLDVYSLGATPTRGAQVVYPITPEEVTATITGDPSELSGVVSATSTEGTVEWSELSEIGIKCIMKRKNPFQ